MYGSTSVRSGSSDVNRATLLTSNGDVADEYGTELDVEALVDFESISKRLEKNNDLMAYNVPQVSKLLTKLGTGQDSSELRLNIRNLLSSTKKMMKENMLLTKKIRDPKILSPTSNNATTIEAEKKKRKTTVDKLNTTFQIWLKKFNEVSEQVTTKERLYPLLSSPSSSLLTVPTGESDGHRRFSSATALNPFTSSQDDEGVLTATKDNRASLSNDNNATAQRYGEEVFSEFDREIIEERERQVKEVHKSMVGLNQVMIDMSTLVHDQENDIQSIEEHISNSVSYTSKGVKELQKAEEHQKASKYKTCCIIGVIILIVVCACLLLAISLGPL